MARKRISEFRAKTLLYKELSLPYSGISVDTNSLEFNPSNLNSQKTYVVKVDQGVKKRFKNNLVLLNQTTDQITNAIKLLQEKGYHRFIIEEHHQYNENEQYLSLERTREGMILYFSKQGGIDIEENQNSILKKNLSQENIESIAAETNLNLEILQKITKSFEENYFSFLELNPFIIKDLQIILLDAAIEVDDTAIFFVNNAWSENDFATGETKQKTTEESEVKQLAAKSQAAFSLEVLNPNGSIFMMLSGGGASIVLADEVYNQGYGHELANYGEYSGNPNAEETYIYAKAVISLMLKSSAPKKTLIIAGGVANFTDIRITFNGLIKALNEYKDKLKNQNIKVFVRRGGPYQDEGLNAIKMFLEKEQILGCVAGPELVLTEIVSKALPVIK